MEFCSPTSWRQPHQRRGRWEVGARLGERLARGEGAANVVALVRWLVGWSVGWLVGWLVNHGKSMGKAWENHGKMVNYMENHNFQWVNPLFLWPFSIANC